MDRDEDSRFTDLRRRVSAIKRLEVEDTSPRAETLGKVRDALVAGGVEFVFQPDGEVEGVLVSRKTLEALAEAAKRERAGRAGPKQVGCGQAEG